MRKFDYLVRFVWCNQVSFPKFKIWFNVIDSQETLEQQHRAFKTFTVFSEFKINLTSICIDINTKELYQFSFNQQYLAFEEFSNTNWEFSHYPLSIWCNGLSIEISFLNPKFKIWCNILLCCCAFKAFREFTEIPTRHSPAKRAQLTARFPETHSSGVSCFQIHSLLAPLVVKTV